MFRFLLFFLFGCYDVTTDATLLELEKTLLDATAKFTSANQYNTKCNHNQVVVASNNRPLSNGRAVMCKYDDAEVTRNNNDEHNVMHLQNKGMSIASAAAPPAQEYLMLTNVELVTSESSSSSPVDGVSPIVIANTSLHFTQ